MITVTTQAITHLRMLIKYSHGPLGQAVKLVSDGKHGLSMSLGLAEDGDMIIHDQGSPVLILSDGVARRLDGLVFDWVPAEVDGQRQGGLTFRQPVGDELAARGNCTP